MFHKFSANPAKARPAQKGLSRGRSTDDVNPSVEQSPLPPATRQKTTRACDRCRLHRIKCGDKKPCVQCVGIKAKCIVSYAPPRASQDSAELDAIRTEALNWNLPRSRPGSSNNSNNGSAPVTSPASPAATSSSLRHEAPSTARSSLEILPDFSSNLTSSIQGFLASGQPAFSRATAVAGCLFPQLPHPAMPSGDPPMPWTPLMGSQWSYYLRVFWDVCHPLFPIMSEAEFAELEALPPPTMFDEYSTKSALIHSMIALGIQCSHATGLASRVLGLQQQHPKQPCGFSLAPSQATWPGFEYFQRCRESMRTNTETTVDVLRSHTLMALYLMKGNAFRDAYNLLGITVRKAYIAKLHRVPPNHLPEAEKNARMQLWWMLFTIDLQCSLQLDIPAAVQKSLVKCPMPSEDEMVSYDSPSSRREKSISTCAYSNCLIRLAVVLSDISACVSTADIVDDDANSPAALEHHALTLYSALNQLETWHDQIPTDLLLARPGTSSGNNDMTDYDREIGLPTWLERQRVLLELHYHNAYTLIQRPFIRLRCVQPINVSNMPTPPESQSHVELHIASAVRHATVIVDRIHNMCSQSEILYGWAEVLQPLWNATLTIIAYVYANSLNSMVPCALASLSRAQAVFDSFAGTCPTALSAKDIVHFLSTSLQSMTIPSSASSSIHDPMGWDLFASLLEEQRTPGSSLYHTNSSSDPFGSFLFSPSELSIPEFDQMAS